MLNALAIHIIGLSALQLIGKSGIERGVIFAIALQQGIGGCPEIILIQGGKVQIQYFPLRRFAGGNRHVGRAVIVSEIKGVTISTLAIYR